MTPLRPGLGAALRALAAHPARDRVWLRGGVVTAALVAPVPRAPDDLDLLVRPGHALADVAAALAEALAPLGAVSTAPLFADTRFPGVRLTVAGVQVDVGAGDPVASPPAPLALDTGDGVVALDAVDRETMVAWKLHGLFERHDGAWRPKDLHDLWLLLRGPVDPERLRAAVALAFASRDAPVWVARRLLDGALGGSPESRKHWRRHLADHPERPGAALPEVVRAVGDALRPVVGPLADAEPPPERFPRLGDGDLDEVRALVAATPGFRAVTGDDQVVFTYEGAPPDGFPDPGGATTRAERRRRQLLRECRGLAFAPDGRLLARKLHKFFGLDPARPPAPGVPEAVEKLDGTLVAAQRDGAGLRLVTRRGPSALGDAATAFAAAAGALPALGAWVDAGWTPCLEWCTPAHPIVHGHPEPALVLVALRRHDTGAYASLDEVEARAAEAGLRAPRRWGPVPDLVAFADEVARRRDGEGAVLVWPDGSRAKVKTDRYRWLHRLVEGPDRVRAASWLALDGDPELRPTAARRGLDVEPLLAWFTAALTAAADRARADVPPGTPRKALAAASAALSPAERRLRFRVHDGEDADAVVAAVVRDALRRAGLPGWLGAPPPLGGG